MCNKGGCWDFHSASQIDFGFSWLSLLYFLVLIPARVCSWPASTGYFFEIIMATDL